MNRTDNDTNHRQTSHPLLSPALSALMACWLFALLSLLPPKAAAAEQIQLGDVFPSLALTPPKSDNDAAYLGVTRKEPFFIKNVSADIVLVEILNTFCFSCQKQAPVYNELHELIQNDPQLKNKVKILGIAVGNTQSAVNAFKNTYAVAFPIIPDENYAIYEAIGGTRTPLSLVLRKNEAYPDGIVLKRHHRITYRLDAMTQDLRALLSVDTVTMQDIARMRGNAPTKEPHVPPLLNDEQTVALLQTSLTDEGKSNVVIEKVELPGHPGVFSVKYSQDGQPYTLMAQVVAKPPTCGVCHNIHFIYTFNAEGRVIGFYPVQLTKYGNAAWTDEDLALFRKAILGKHITTPWNRDDVQQIVTSASITTSVILHNITKGEGLYRALQDKKLL